MKNGVRPFSRMQGFDTMSSLPKIWQQCEEDGEKCKYLHEYIECGHGRWVTTCTSNYLCKRNPRNVDRFKKKERK